MTKAAKLIEAMRRNPAGDWAIADIQRLCAQLGWQFLAPAHGSHWKVVVPGRVANVTIPARRPVKPVYIRKLLALVDGGLGDG